MKDRTKELIDEVLKISAIIALILVVILVIIYSIIPEDKSYFIFIKSVLPNLVPLLLVFSVSVLILKKIISIKKELEQDELISKFENILKSSLGGIHDNLPPIIYQEFNQVDFKPLIEKSGKIEIIVHYFDSWLNRHRLSFKEFFNNGGDIQLILPNPDNKILIELINQRITELDSEMIKSKIKNTHERIKSWADKSNHKKAAVSVIYTDKLINYSAIKFDNRYIVISVFSHTRDERIVEAPAFLIDISRNIKINEWLLTEIDYFFR